MPDIKFSQLGVVTAAASNDLIPIIDASNPLMSENGSNAIISVGDFADSLFGGLGDGSLSSSKIQTNPTFIGAVTLPNTTTIGGITGTEIEFLEEDPTGIKSELVHITGVVIEADYENSVFKVNSYERIYEVDLSKITKILNNTKFKYNLNKLNNIDFL